MEDEESRWARNVKDELATPTTTLDDFLVRVALTEGEFTRSCAALTPTTRRLDWDIARLSSEGAIRLANHPHDPRVREGAAQTTRLHEDWGLWKAGSNLRGLVASLSAQSVRAYILAGLKSRYGEEANDDLLPNVIRALNAYDGQSRPSEWIDQYLGRAPAPATASPITEQEFCLMVLGAFSSAKKDWPEIGRPRLLATWRLFNTDRPLPVERGSARNIKELLREGAKLLGTAGRPLLMRLEGKTIKAIAAAVSLEPSTVSEKIPILTARAYRAFFEAQSPLNSESAPG